MQLFHLVKESIFSAIFFLNISSAAVSRVPTLISSKRYHKYTYSRVSRVTFWKNHSLREWNETWYIHCMFQSMLVLWYRSEMSDSRGHDLHRNWTDFNHIWQKFSRGVAQQSHELGYFDGHYLKIFVLNNILRVFNEFCNTCIY